MLKAVGQAANPSRPMVLLGLTRENVRRLMDDQPIVVELTDLDLPPMSVVIIGGQDQATLARELARIGMVTAEAAEQIALAEARMEVDPDAPRESRWP